MSKDKIVKTINLRKEIEYDVYREGGTSTVSKVRVNSKLYALLNCVLISGVPVAEDVTMDYNPERYRDMWKLEF